MTRKKVKLSWVVNENSRSLSLNKRRQGLVKKVRELTILCDVYACLIMFSPNVAEPMVWPSIEATRDLLDDFFALTEIERKKKETNLETYLKEKTKKVREKLKKSHKKNTEYVVDQLMMQLHRGRRINDLSPKEIYELLSFSRDTIMFCRKKIESVQHLPLRDPPMFQAQSEELTTTMNDAFLGGLHDVERAENQSRYLMDQWFFASSEPPTPRINQQMEMNRFHYNENPNPRSYLPYQGSSSNGNPNLEMVPIGHQVMPNFHGFVGSSSQPLHHHNMNIDPRMAMMNQPRQYPFAFMSRELEVKEECNNMNNGDPQLDRSSNAMMINDSGLGQEPPPSDGTIADNDNVDATPSDINKVWPGINKNHHF